MWYEVRPQACLEGKWEWGRKERGSKKGGMGPKEGQHAKVLLCGTRERKKVGDLVTWRFCKYQSRGTESLLWYSTLKYTYIYFSKCVKKGTVLPTQAAHPTPLPLLPTRQQGHSNHMLGSVPKFVFTVRLKPCILGVQVFVDATDIIGGEFFKAKPKHL